MDVLLATRNSGKLREIRDLLRDLPVSLFSLADRGIAVDIPETGATFYDNARLKADGYCRLSGLTTMADDSGLEVNALNGEPGVRSARWAVDGASDSDRIALLLERLRGVPAEQRGARFRCVIAIVTPDGRAFSTEGTLPGTIAEAPRGAHGFGYDPVLLLPEVGLTVAELSPEEKNRISHRARAVLAARPILAALACQQVGETGRV